MKSKTKKIFRGTLWFLGIVALSLLIYGLTQTSSNNSNENVKESYNNESFLLRISSGTGTQIHYYPEGYRREYLPIEFYSRKNSFNYFMVEPTGKLGSNFINKTMCIKHNLDALTIIKVDDIYGSLGESRNHAPELDKITTSDSYIRCYETSSSYLYFFKIFFSDHESLENKEIEIYFFER